MIEQLSDILEKNLIKKVIDPGSTDTVQTGINRPQSSASILYAPAPTVAQTSLSMVLSDVTSLAQLVQTNAQSVINNIVAANPDTNLASYSALAANITWNPASMLTDSSSRPNTTQLQVNVTAVTEVERDMYRRLTDPRTSSILDLNQIIAQAGSSQYLLNTLYNQLVTPNNLYPNTNDSDSITRMNIYREQMHLKSLNNQVNSINANTFNRVTDCFIQSFAHNLKGNVPGSSTNLSPVISQLKTLITLLQVTQITNNANWEQIMNSLRNSYGQIFNNLSARLLSTQSSMTASMINSSVSSLISSLGSNSNTQSALCLAESTEFGKQLTGSIFGQLRKSEDHLIALERTDYETERHRSLAINNTQKNSYTQQYITMLNATINYLQGLQSTTQFNANSLTNSIGQSITTMANNGSVSPASPLLSTITVTNT